MATVLPNHRWPDPDGDVEALYDAVRGVPLSDEHRRAIYTAAGVGAQHVNDLVSLIHAVEIYYGTRAVPGEPRSVRDAYDLMPPPLHHTRHLWDAPCPPGSDEAASAGLASFLRVGEHPAGGNPWWYCSRCRRGRFGPVDVALERRCAQDHYEQEHAGGGRRG
ncbi:hypothetical protein [Streptomonospora nanhaiensis]|uniref:hypothetical protein n=1 Tax=Streptomonospora nanhaiensis TaxID=1323731 RepID=UPI001C386959|nr:hypothetical protein [Streptomonospora nanhaiensis]MBV2366941.1 hypothetical protein [Streptomonospora nanhaiensis]